MNTPQHPGNAPQAGLESTSVANPYHSPNQALQAANAKQANAQADKVRAETAMMQQASGLGNPVQAGPTVTPEQVQVGQLTDGLVRGQISQEQLQMGIQSGEISQAAAEAAMGQAQQFMAQDQQRMQQQGLGGGF